MTAGCAAASKLERRRRVADLIRARVMGSQEEVVDALAADGLRVTQATVSRDLTELGALKVRRGGALVYALPGDVGPGELPEARLRKALQEWVEALEAAGAMIVLRTPPGSASIVAAALDHAARPEVAGCLAGDDTVVIVVRDGYRPAEVLATLQALAAG